MATLGKRAMELKDGGQLCKWCVEERRGLGKGVMCSGKKRRKNALFRILREKMSNMEAMVITARGT